MYIEEKYEENYIGTTYNDFYINRFFGKSYNNEEKKDIIIEVSITKVNEFIDILDENGYEEHKESDDDYIASPIATTTEMVKESVKNVVDGVDSEKNSECC